MNDSITFDFSKLSPNGIVKERMLIEQLFDNHINTGDFLIKNLEKYAFIKEKLLKNSKLSIKELRLLSNVIGKMYEDNIFDLFYKYFFNNYNENKNICSDNIIFRGLLCYIYEEKDFKVFQMFKVLDNEKYKNILLMIKNSNDVHLFYKKLDYLFDQVKNEQDINLVADKLLISRNSEFYKNTIVTLIRKKYSNAELFDFFISELNKLNHEKKRIAYESILLKYYRNNVRKSEYPNEWFRHILSDLGDPNEKYNGLWNGYSEESKKVFSRWIVGDKLDKILSDDRDDKYDAERYNYWMKIYNNDIILEIFDNKKLNGIFVMRLENHTIVDFLETGNAMRIYHKDDPEYSYKMIINVIKSSHWTNTEKIAYFRRRKHGYNHSGDWQVTFDIAIRGSGYSVDYV